jgi:hypothetical protein
MLAEKRNRLSGIVIHRQNSYDPRSRRSQREVQSREPVNKGKNLPVVHTAYVYSLATFILVRSQRTDSKWACNFCDACPRVFICSLFNKLSADEWLDDT